MVVAVQQWLAARTTNFTVCRPIVEHGRPPCTVTIHKTCTDQQWNGLQNSFRVQDQRAIYVLTTNTSNTLISANRPRCGENLKKSWLATWLDIKRLTWTQLCLSLTLVHSIIKWTESQSCSGHICLCFWESKSRVWLTVQQQSNMQCNRILCLLTNTPICTKLHVVGRQSISDNKNKINKLDFFYFKKSLASESDSHIALLHMCKHNTVTLYQQIVLTVIKDL